MSTNAEENDTFFKLFSPYSILLPMYLAQIYKNMCWYAVMLQVDKDSQNEHLGASVLLIFYKHQWANFAKLYAASFRKERSVTRRKSWMIKTQVSGFHVPCHLNYPETLPCCVVSESGEKVHPKVIRHPNVDETTKI